MNNTTIYQETTITIHEEGRSQTLMHVLHLRIREGKPYLLHLIFAKETVDNLNAGTQESHILQPFFQSLLAINLGPDGFRARLDQAFQELFMKHLGHLKSSHILSQYFSAMALKTTDLMVTESIAGQDMKVYAKLAQAMCKAVIETSKNFGN